MTDPSTASAAASLNELGARASRNVETLDHELAEIELLVQQAKAEASRHETKRAQAAERLTAMATAPPGDPREAIDLGNQVVTLTRRAVLMEAQVEVLEGKAKILHRYRDEVAQLAEGLAAQTVATDGQDGTVGAAPAAGGTGVSRLVLTAQEDLRREIARQMHDGPAQSLTNIVLQAQIVDRLLARDPEQARNELRHLQTMVQSTLDATKSFIFDVRPMVLDDLGLVPTLRRAARERGRRAQIAVEFESLGPDRRLSVDLESGLFRMLDEALAAFLSGQPDRVSMRLDWGDQVEARIAAERSAPEVALPDLAEPPPVDQKRGRGKQQELPPALAAMIEDRKADRSAAVEAARVATLVPLPATAWREIQDRATSLGIVAELLAEGTEVRLVAEAAGPETAEVGQG